MGQQIMPDFLENHAEKKSLFISARGVLIRNEDHCFLLPLYVTISKLQLVILGSYLDRDQVVIFFDTQLPEANFENNHYSIKNIKSLVTVIAIEQQQQLLKAAQWANWHQQSKYCGRCGNLLQEKFSTPEKLCFTCKTSFFPRFSPAIMVFIRNQDKLLLARSPHFTPGVYSVLAGFIDMGESAEQAVHREVKEEVSLEITDLTYFSTQSWPFPDSFMIAFTANYKGGELKIDPKELEDAKWFSLDELPELPIAASIARCLIDSQIKKMREE